MNCSSRARSFASPEIGYRGAPTPASFTNLAAIVSTCELTSNFRLHVWRAGPALSCRHHNECGCPGLRGVRRACPEPSRRAGDFCDMGYGICPSWGSLARKQQWGKIIIPHHDSRPRSRSYRVSRRNPRPPRLCSGLRQKGRLSGNRGGRGSLIVNIPTQAKTGLEKATRPNLKYTSPQRLKPRLMLSHLRRG